MTSEEAKELYSQLRREKKYAPAAWSDISGMNIIYECEEFIIVKMIRATLRGGYEIPNGIYYADPRIWRWRANEYREKLQKVREEISCTE